MVCLSIIRKKRERILVYGLLVIIVFVGVIIEEDFICFIDEGYLVLVLFFLCYCSWFEDLGISIWLVSKCFCWVFLFLCVCLVLIMYLFLGWVFVCLFWMEIGCFLNCCVWWVCRVDIGF